MDKAAVSHIVDLCKRRSSGGELRTNFLDMAAQSEAASICAREGANYAFFGGYEEAERKLLFILADYEDDFDSISIRAQSAITAIDIKCPGDLAHRDYLGAILALGVKRECIGDIIVGDSGAIALCTHGISDYILSSLNKIGRQNASLEVINLSDVHAVERPMKRIKTTVASMRLDGLAASAFSTSRAKMSKLIDLGDVSLNWTATTDRSAEVSEGDVISVRKMGRARIASIGGKSRKDRIFVEIEVYV